MTEPLVGVVMGSASDWDTMQHCAQQLEDFMVPKRVVFRDVLPKTDTGKVSRRQVAEMETAS